jgi:hypothetical protein
MITNVSIHLEESTKVEAAIRTGYAVVKFGEYGDHGLYFRSEAHLRSFAVSVLQQLDAKEEQIA